MDKSNYQIYNDLRICQRKISCEMGNREYQHSLNHRSEKEDLAQILKSYRMLDTFYLRQFYMNSDNIPKELFHNLDNDSKIIEKSESIKELDYNNNSQDIRNIIKYIQIPPKYHYFTTQKDSVFISDLLDKQLPEEYSISYALIIFQSPQFLYFLQKFAPLFLNIENPDIDQFITKFSEEFKSNLRYCSPIIKSLLLQANDDEFCLQLLTEFLKDLCKRPHIYHIRPCYEIIFDPLIELNDEQLSQISKNCLQSLKEFEFAKSALDYQLAPFLKSSNYGIDKIDKISPNPTYSSNPKYSTTDPQASRVNLTDKYNLMYFREVLKYCPNLPDISENEFEMVSNNFDSYFTEFYRKNISSKVSPQRLNDEDDDNEKFQVIKIVYFYGIECAETKYQPFLLENFKKFLESKNVGPYDEGEIFTEKNLRNFIFEKDEEEKKVKNRQDFIRYLIHLNFSCSRIISDQLTAIAAQIISKTDLKPFYNSLEKLIKEVSKDQISVNWTTPIEATMQKKIIMKIYSLPEVYAYLTIPGVFQRAKEIAWDFINSQFKNTYMIQEPFADAAKDISVFLVTQQVNLSTLFNYNFNLITGNSLVHNYLLSMKDSFQIDSGLENLIRLYCGNLHKEFADTSVGPLSKAVKLNTAMEELIGKIRREGYPFTEKDPEGIILRTINPNNLFSSLWLIETFIDKNSQTRLVSWISVLKQIVDEAIPDNKAFFYMPSEEKGIVLKRDKSNKDMKVNELCSTAVAGLLFGNKVLDDTKKADLVKSVSAFLAKNDAVRFVDRTENEPVHYKITFRDKQEPREEHFYYVADENFNEHSHQGKGKVIVIPSIGHSWKLYCDGKLKCEQATLSEIFSHDKSESN